VVGIELHQAGRVEAVGRLQLELLQGWLARAHGAAV
jgi:hypothetical protein